MPVQPVQLSQLGANWFKVKAMLLGAQFTGKTIFALGSQKMRTLHFDVDSYGLLSAKCFMGNPQTGIPPIRQDLIESIAINKVNDIFDAIDYLEKNINKYDLGVVDTITDYQKMVVNSLVGNDHANLTDNEWGPVLNTMNQVTQRLKRLPIHIIYNAHESNVKRSVNVNGTMQPVFTPAFDGQFLDIYQTHFSEIWRYFTINQYAKDVNGIAMVQTERWIQCQMDETFNSKDRVNILNKYEPPMIDYIFDKIMGHVQSNGTQNTNQNIQQITR